MTARRNTPLVALATILALALGASAAPALRSLELRPGGAITATARALTFSEPGGLTITANVTFTGNLNTRIAKTTGAIMGEIRTCAFGEVRGFGMSLRVRCDLNKPWPIIISSINGTLPLITRVLFVIGKLSFLIEATSGGGRVNECLYGGTAQRLLGAAEEIGADTAVLGARREFREFTSQASKNKFNLIASIEERIQGCARDLSYTGTFNFTTAQTVTLV